MDLLVLESHSSCFTEYSYECELRISIVHSPAISTLPHSVRSLTVCRSCERTVSSRHSDSGRCRTRNQRDSDSSWSDESKSRAMQISSDSRSDPGSMQPAAWTLRSPHSAGSSQEKGEQTSSSENSSISTRRGNEPPRPNTNELSRVSIALARYCFLMQRTWIMGSSDLWLVVSLSSTTSRVS